MVIAKVREMFFPQQLLAFRWNTIWLSVNLLPSNKPHGIARPLPLFMAFWRWCDERSGNSRSLHHRALILMWDCFLVLCLIGFFTLPVFSWKCTKSSREVVVLSIPRK